MTTELSLKTLFSSSDEVLRRTYVIAEIGINHEGNFEQCAEMVGAFANAGANAVKLQTVNADLAYASGTASHRVFSQASLTREETEKIFDLARKYKVEPFTTSGDLETLEWVDKLNPVAHKVSSGLLSCSPIVVATCKLRKPVILSTGMSSDCAIDDAVNMIKKQKCDVALLQCTSEYPCPEDKLNLAAINTLRERHQVPVGFSDHSIGFHVAPLAVAVGARIIEKHVTFDSSRQGFDHSIALNVDEFAKMVCKIRETEVAIGDGKKRVNLSAESSASHFERRLAAARDLDSGHTLSINDLLFMRFPSEIDAISSKDTNTVIGRSLSVSVKKRHHISWRCLS